MHEWSGPNKYFCNKCGCLYCGLDRKDPCPEKKEKE